MKIFSQYLKNKKGEKKIYNRQDKQKAQIKSNCKQKNVNKLYVPAENILKLN